MEKTMWEIGRQMAAVELQKITSTTTLLFFPASLPDGT
jgi:hypothetical protein